MSKRKHGPIIGITGPSRRGAVSWLFNRLGVRRFGGRPRLITPRRLLDVHAIDGLIVAGGADIDPALYGQTNVASRNVDPLRDRLECDLLRAAIERKKPILGICRGMQLLNVALGGTLHQEASEVYDGFHPTKGLYRKWTLRRPVHVIRQGWLSSLLGTGKKVHLVNSLHHQAIAEIAGPLEVVAVDEHGMVQAIEFKEKDFFVLGVQWHPELMIHSRVQTSFFRALVHACVHDDAL